MLEYWYNRGDESALRQTQAWWDGQLGTIQVHTPELRRGHSFMDLWERKGHGCYAPSWRTGAAVRTFPPLHQRTHFLLRNLSFIDKARAGPTPAGRAARRQPRMNIMCRTAPDTRDRFLLVSSSVLEHNGFVIEKVASRSQATASRGRLIMEHLERRDRTSILIMRFFLFFIFLTLATISTAAQPVVEIYQTSITQARIDAHKKYRSVIAPEMPEAGYVSSYIWDCLTIEIFKAEADKRNIAPDPSYVQMKIDENRTSMTAGQYNDLKKAEKVINELRVEFSRSKGDVDAFVKRTWTRRGPELSRLNIASDVEGLRSYLLLLDAKVDMIGSRPDALPPTRDTFLKQVNDTSNNSAFFEFMSRIEQVKDAVAGKVSCSPDELARGGKYFDKHKAALSKRESFMTGGLNGLLQALKKENLVDRWVMEKMKQDVKFHDSVIEEAFFKWMASTRPRHHEVFGPQ